MIYILVGNDYKNKNKYIEKLVNSNQFCFMQTSLYNKADVLGYTTSGSLFGEKQILVIENVITENLIDLVNEELEVMKNSESIFIFIEDKLSSILTKKYLKFSEIKVFEEKIVKKDNSFNVFEIANHFSYFHKAKTWFFYIKAIEEGIEPENISGILFWKLKDMFLKGSKFFTKEEIKKMMSEIVSIYHKAHRGEIDFVVGLEKFILKSLTK